MLYFKYELWYKKMSISPGYYTKIYKFLGRCTRCQKYRIATTSEIYDSYLNKFKLKDDWALIKTLEPCAKCNSDQIRNYNNVILTNDPHFEIFSLKIPTFENDYIKKDSVNKSIIDILKFNNFNEVQLKYAHSAKLFSSTEGFIAKFDEYRNRKTQDLNIVTYKDLSFIDQIKDLILCEKRKIPKLPKVPIITSGFDAIKQHITINDWVAYTGPLGMGVSRIERFTSHNAMIKNPKGGKSIAQPPNQLVKLNEDSIAPYIMAISLEK